MQKYGFEEFRSGRMFIIYPFYYHGRVRGSVFYVRIPILI